MTLEQPAREVLAAHCTDATIRSQILNGLNDPELPIGEAVDAMLAFAAHARAEAIEEAAKACEQQARDFLDPQFAYPQPMGSITERFACAQCATAIRALNQPLDGGA